MNKLKIFFLTLTITFFCGLCSADAQISANVHLSVELHESITAISEPDQNLASERIPSECAHLLQVENKTPTESESNICRSGTKLVSTEHKPEQILLTVEPI